jgi:hypothetical protein
MSARTGIIYDEPFAEYLAADAVGSHSLADMEPHPLLFKMKHVTRELVDDYDTPAFRFGRYFHALALEGEAAALDRFAMKPEGIDRRTKEGKVAFAEFEAEAAGHDIVTADDVALAWKMLGAIRAKPGVCALLDAATGKPEVTFRHNLASFAIQARVDWFDNRDPAAPICINLKTIDRLANFDRQFESYKYYRGDAFYSLVVAKVLGLDSMQPQMIDLVVEKEAPWQCAVRTPDAASLQVGAQEVMELLQKLKGCYESGIWPGEPDVARPVTLSQWKLTKSLS